MDEKSLMWVEIQAQTVELGCQIFLVTTYQKGEKYTKQPQNIPKGNKIYHLMTTKYAKGP
jgi:hypothetical protein